LSETALIPMADLERMATVMAASAMFGKNKEEIISLMLVAQAEGIHPARAVQEYDIIQHKPALKSQAALARFIDSGGKVEWVTRTDSEATAKFHHPSQINPITVTWNMEKANRMGFAGKDNWKKQPGIMLQWRTVSEGIRICNPACLNRMYTVEEMQDIDTPSEPRNVTPPKDAIPAEPVDDLKAAQIAARNAGTAARESGFFTNEELDAMSLEYKSNAANKPSLEFLAKKWTTEIMERRTIPPIDEDGVSAAFDAAGKGA
jgi:hypothetical protein